MCSGFEIEKVVVWGSIVLATSANTFSLFIVSFSHFVPGVVKVRYSEEILSSVLVFAIVFQQDQHYLYMKIPNFFYCHFKIFFLSSVEESAQCIHK